MSDLKFHQDKFPMMPSSQLKGNERKKIQADIVARLAEAENATNDAQVAKVDLRGVVEAAVQALNESEDRPK